MKMVGRDCLKVACLRKEYERMREWFMKVPRENRNFYISFFDPLFITAA